jgi:hypothetical protein
MGLVVDNMISQSALLPENWPKHLKCDFVFLNMDVLDYLQQNTNRPFDVVIHASAIGLWNKTVFVLFNNNIKTTGV